MAVGIGKDREYEEAAQGATANRRLLQTEKKETMEEILERWALKHSRLPAFFLSPVHMQDGDGS